MKSSNIIVLAAAVFFTAACQNKNPQQPSLQQDVEANDTIQADILPNTTLPDTNGRQIDLHGEIAKHNITIIDFWASWCGPCLAEIPHLVKLYSETQSKGVQIIGISLDEDKADWQEAIKSNDMKWLQLSDLKGWEGIPTKQYGVTSIPFTVIVNSRGEILATGLRGEELSQFVKSRIAPSPTDIGQ